MQIKVRNQTTLTDYSALMRAALYLGGCITDAQEGGFHFEVTRCEAGTVVKITEKEPEGLARRRTQVIKK